MKWWLLCIASSAAGFALLACPGEECAYYNDCPAGSFCNPDRVCEEYDPCPEGVGDINGQVTSPGGAAQIIGAEVTIEGYGTTTTDANGQFTFTDVPSGQHNIDIVKNDFRGFHSVQICGDTDNNIALDIAPPPHSFAVVPGDFDSIEIVLQNMGLVANEHFDYLQATDLKNVTNLSGYNVLFLNCTGSPLGADTEVQSTLRAFVNAGGRVYASDWAYEYVEETWPDAVHFNGDLAGSPNPKIGQIGEATATVHDPDLSQYLGKTSVALNYDLPAWVVMEGAADTTNVLIEADATFTELGLQPAWPLLVQFDQGDGSVIYTTFHNEAQTTGDMDAILTYLVFTL